MENNRQLKLYLDFFKNNKIELNKSNSLKLIDDIFDRDIFMKEVVYLEKNKFIIKNNKENNILFLTEKGEKCLLQINNEIEYEDEKERIDFEKSKVDLNLNKWLLKTKWLPHFIAFISFLFAVYVYFDSKNDSKKLEERIEKLESKILIPKNESKK